MIAHSHSAPFYEDGFVQTYTLNTKPLSKYDSVYISISARNYVSTCTSMIIITLIVQFTLTILRKLESGFVCCNIWYF